jgi:hypothetical protein
LAIIAQLSSNAEEKLCGMPWLSPDSQFSAVMPLQKEVERGGKVRKSAL